MPDIFGALPYQLSLMKLINENWQHTCGATLINKKYAISAYNCFILKEQDIILPLGKFKVVAGRYRHNDTVNNVSSIGFPPASGVV